MSKSTEHSKCRICGMEIAEGWKLQRPGRHRALYVCMDCQDLIHAVAHDAAYDIFDDISKVMSETDETWKEHLELWSEKGGEKS